MRSAKAKRSIGIRNNKTETSKTILIKTCSVIGGLAGWGREMPERALLLK
jgi:hypothetical protein